LTIKRIMKNYFTKSIRIQIIIFLTFLSISGCEKIEIGEPTIFRIGTKYRIDNNLSFTIESIIDYRCPRNVYCFWSGDVEFNFKIYHILSKTDTLIYLYTHENNPFNIGGYTFKINDVNPWLESGQKANQSDYRINISIIKN
jgi:hypothetical protein